MMYFFFRFGFVLVLGFAVLCEHVMTLAFNHQGRLNPACLQMLHAYTNSSFGTR